MLSPNQLQAARPPALRQSISLAAPKMLAKLLEQNNIPSIGTHVFYQRMAGSNPSVSRNYLYYERNVFQFLASLPASYISKRMVLVPDCISNVQKTSELLASLGINAVPNYFISPDGTLTSPNFLFDNLRPEEVAVENSNMPVYDKITAFAKEGRVFVFGLYIDNCLLRTKDSLCGVAPGFKPELFENSSLTLSSGRLKIS